METDMPQTHPVSERSEVALRLMAHLIGKKSLTVRWLVDTFTKLYEGLPEVLDEAVDVDNGCDCAECQAACQTIMGGLGQQYKESVIEACMPNAKTPSDEAHVTLAVSLPKSIYDELQKVVMVTKSGNVCMLRPGESSGTWQWDAGNL